MEEEVRNMNCVNIGEDGMNEEERRRMAPWGGLIYQIAIIGSAGGRKEGRRALGGREDTH